MKANASAPLLSRIKSWQLVGLGISGWVALYSAAIISWGGSSFVVGNAQGGCFATAMALAGVEVRRFQKGRSVPVDPLQWTCDISTEQLNRALAQNLQKQELRVESPHRTETGMGFGLRAVKAGRTLIFETARWKEPVIDLQHAQATEENRKKTIADLVIIVGVGTPDEDARMFVNTHPMKLLVGQELKDMFTEEQPPVENIEPPPDAVADASQPRPPGNMA